MENIKKKIKVLLKEEEIDKKIDEIAALINEHYKGNEIILVGVIKGALPFFLKLARKIKLPQTWDFMALSSYGNRTETSGIVKINMDLASSISGKHVLIIEDIIDTGLTMEYVMKVLNTRKPASIKVCTLLLKDAKLSKKIPVDFAGFKIPNKFVVGFGLDYEEKYRELPYIGYIDQ